MRFLLVERTSVSSHAQRFDSGPNPTKWQFEELLGRRKVTRPYDEDDLAVDLAYARRSQLFLTTDSFGEDETLELISRLYRRILIPPAVWREVVEESDGRPGALEMERAVAAGWMVRQAAKNEIWLLAHCSTDKMISPYPLTYATG